MTKKNRKRIVFWFATLYFSFFVLWCIAAKFGICDYPTMIWTFLAGMEYEYLSHNYIIPWIKGEL